MLQQAKGTFATDNAKQLRIEDLGGAAVVRGHTKFAHQMVPNLIYVSQRPDLLNAITADFSASVVLRRNDSRRIIKPRTARTVFDSGGHLGASAPPNSENGESEAHSLSCSRWSASPVS